MFCFPKVNYVKLKTILIMLNYNLIFFLIFFTFYNVKGSEQYFNMSYGSMLEKMTFYMPEILQKMDCENLSKYTYTQS